METYLTESGNTLQVGHSPAVAPARPRQAMDSTEISTILFCTTFLVHGVLRTERYWQLPTSGSYLAEELPVHQEHAANLTGSGCVRAAAAEGPANGHPDAHPRGLLTAKSGESGASRICTHPRTVRSLQGGVPVCVYAPSL
jgi:hypothetical protein